MPVSIRNLSKSFGSRQAVNSLDLEIARGELFGIVGSDGAGKTTTLRILAGLMEPDAGDADIFGSSCRDLSNVRNRIGYMSQRFALYHDLTVVENIRFFADMFSVPPKKREERMAQLLKFSALASFSDRLAGRLSGGMKQKLGLCCALIHTPELLILDEPTNGVDPVSRRDFWRILAELQNEGVTIIVATAYLDEAERCDRVAMMHKGELIACGAPSELTGSHFVSLEELVISGISAGAPLPQLDRSRRVTVSEKNVVELYALHKNFASFVAVDHISLKVPQGEIFGFLGPNGAGKSTTIKMLCGILTPSGGSGTVAGCDIIAEPERIKENIGYMSQRFSLYEELTVEENIAFYAGVYRLPDTKRRERTEWVIEMAGLGDRRNSKAGKLSGGWKQRLALGCAILHEPPIIFLDEPTSGVDPLSRRNFWQLIRELASTGTTVFVTTHYMDEAEFCDRIAMIYQGGLIAVGTPEELKRSRIVQTLEQLFIELIEERVAKA